MRGLTERAEALAQARIARMRGALEDSLAIWFPGVLLLVEASGIRVAGRGLRARWDRLGLSQRLRETADEW